VFVQAKPDVSLNMGIEMLTASQDFESFVDHTWLQGNVIESDLRE
jgi:hypothetical protein